jgi:adhesin/invasin
LGGGTVEPASAITDADGRANTIFTLGDLVGAQTVSATTASLPGASATFNATSVSTSAGNVAVFAGNLQTALAATAVATAPAARVTDPQGNPVPGIPVEFAVAQGGGTVTGATATTDANGVATLGSWTLGPVAAINALTATVTGLTPVQFLALGTGTNGAFTLAIGTGNGQTTLAGTAVPVVPTVVVQDSGGAPVQGVTIDFAVTAGTGALGNASTTTDAAGIASVGSWTLGTVGANAFTASGLGLPSVSFTATATVGTPAAIAIVSGNGQSATNGTALPQPLAIEVQDAGGNPVPGIMVTFGALQGSVNPTSVTTAADGRAQTTWTLGTNAINQTATASAGGVTPAVFTATAVFPNPTVLVALVGNDRIAVGSPGTLGITLTQPAPTGGVTVTITSDNASIVGPASQTVVIAENEVGGEATLNGVGGGSTIVRGNAPGYQEGTVTIPVSLQVLSLPLTLTVPFGGTRSLPIQISTPAPAGGVAVTLVSDNPAAVAVVTPSVTIPQGALTANATVSGVTPGSGTVTGTTAAFGTAQSAVSTTANFDITVASASINASFGQVVTIELESGGTPIAAPAGGIAVTMVSRDATCAVGTSPVTIPPGLVSTTSTLSYGGSATLNCSTLVLATATGIAPDSVSVNVAPQPGISHGTSAVGAGLQRQQAASLGASNHGGVDVVVKSLDAGVVRIAPNTTTPGGDSVVVSVPAGQTTVSYVVEAPPGIADTGNASAMIEVRAPGFVTATTAQAVHRAAVRVAGLNPSTSTFTADDPFVAQIGALNNAGTALQEFQIARAGDPPPVVTFQLSDSAVAQLVVTAGIAGTVTAPISVGQVQSPGSVATGGVAFRAVTAGSTVVSASIPGFVPEPGLGSQIVTITAPTISTFTSAVGAGLQRASSSSLGAPNHGGVDVVVKSLDPTVFKIAPNSTTPGDDSIVVTLANGQQNVSYVVEGVPGVADTGNASAQLEVRALGFVTNTTVQAVHRPAVRIAGLNTTTSTFTPDDAFVVQIGALNAAGTGLQEFQGMRAGAAPPLATLQLTDSAVAQLVLTAGPTGTATVSITAGQVQSPGSVGAGGVAFRAVSGGSSTVNATIPGFVPEPGQGSQTVTISAPTIFASTSAVGAGLQRTQSVSLAATNHGGVDVVIKSLAPSVFRIGPNATTPGDDSIVVAVPDGQSNVTYVVEGVPGVADTGNASGQIEARALGFVTATVNQAVQRPAIRMAALITNTTSLSPDDPFVVQIGVLNAPGTALQEFQIPRAGTPALTATLTSSAGGVGQLVNLTGSGASRTVDIPAGQLQSPSTVAADGIAFDAVAAGQTIVSVTLPGFVQEPGQGAQTVTVVTPGITLTTATVGSRLMRSFFGSLGAPSTRPGGDTVIVRSSQPGVALVSATTTSPIADTAIVVVPNGSTGFTYVVHGVADQTGDVAVTAKANGYQDGSAPVTISTPGVTISGLVTTHTAGGTDDAFTVLVGILSGVTIVESQAVSPSAGPLAFDVLSSVPAVGNLVITANQPDGAGAVTVPIPTGAAASPGSVALGGVAFNPLAQGTTNVSVSRTGFTAANGSTVAITVNP